MYTQSTTPMPQKSKPMPKMPKAPMPKKPMPKMSMAPLPMMPMAMTLEWMSNVLDPEPDRGRGVP